MSFQWQKICTEFLKNVFSNTKKMASKNIFQHFFRANFFMFVLLISNHTVFLAQFEINLYEWVFQKAEIALANWKRLVQFQLFEKLTRANFTKVWNHTRDFKMILDQNWTTLSSTATFIWSILNSQICQTWLFVFYFPAMWLVSLEKP